MTADTPESLKEQLKEELSRIQEKKGGDKAVSANLEHSEYSDEPIDEASIDPHMEEALKQGYDPNYKGPNKKSPEQFVKDGSFFKKIDALKKEQEETKKVVRELAEQNAKLAAIAAKERNDKLEAAKERAILEADNVKVRAIDAELRKAEAEAIRPIAPEKPTVTQELLDFQEENKSWFNNQTKENIRMVKAAEALDQLVAEELEEKGEKISQKEHLARVVERIKVLFPNRFENEKQLEKPKVLRSGTSGSSTGNTVGLAARLTTRQKELAAQARQYGSKMTNEQYAAQLELTGDLRDE
jgi:hypothetical protein